MENLIEHSNIAIATLASVVVFLATMVYKLVGWWRDDAKETRDALSAVNQTLIRLSTLIEVQHND